MNRASQDRSPVLEYARHLLALHELDLQGKNDSDEADAIRERMDASWYAMTSQERERMGGLSEDLYAIAQGGPPRVAMNAKETDAWRKELQQREARYQNGDVDGWLAFLRKPRPLNSPRPGGIPASVVHVLQAQSWSKLDDHHTAAIFLKAAEEFDPQLTLLCLSLART